MLDRLLAAALISLSFAAVPAKAFNCAKASTDVEKAICADPALKELDDALGRAYAGVRAASDAPEQKMLARSQKRWIKVREYCGQAEEGIGVCVRRVTEERLRLLAGAAETGPGTEGELIPVFLVQDGTEKVYDLDIAVLRFADPRVPGEKTLNRIASDILDRAKLGPHGEDTFGRIYAQQDGLSISYASPDFMSVMHSFWGDTGGAHGNGGVQNFNIDMATGRVLEIGDVMPESAMAPLATRCRGQIIAEKTRRLPGEPYDPGTDSFLDNGVIAEHLATLSRWSIRADTVTITFDSYAIGSYAEGPYACEFATAEIRAMAIDGAPIP